MRSMRHPNPLIDVRRPRRGERIGVNPPGFVWPPIDAAPGYRIQLSRERTFNADPVEQFEVGPGRTLFVPPEPLAAGRWFWRWTAGGAWSQVFAFTIQPDASEVRPEQAARRAAERPHPRAMVGPGGVEALRTRWRDGKPELLAQVRTRADELLALPHELDEPPFLPEERSVDYNTVHVAWRKALTDTRRFCGQTVELAMAFLVSGEVRYAQAAGRRLDSLARWDPDGSTSIPHNDEPHMAVMDGGPIAFDWIVQTLDDAQRQRIVAHLARRAHNTHRLLAEQGYGIRHFGSHSGRMLGFLGQAGLALAGHDARAESWLRFVLELMASMYPVWGGHDGGWGEGFSYCAAYIRWILRFCLSARTALGADLYRKPFFRNHARWWAICLPEYAAQTPFGDGGDRAIQLVHAAVITGHLGRMTADPAVLALSERFARRARSQALGGHGVSTGTSDLIFPDVQADPLLALADQADPPPRPASGAKPALPRAACFRDVGYVALRSHPDDPDRDICLIFKSSPYGPVSHSHGDQNCFVLSAFGQPLAIRTGYYTGYSNPHHSQWLRQTRAHNGVTVGGVGQWVRNPSAGGAITAFAARRDFAYARGDAGRAYGDRLTRFQRHVLFVDYRYFLIVDDLAAPFETTFEQHLHAIEPMEVDPAGRRARIARNGAFLDAYFLNMLDMRFHPSDRFDPPNDDPGFPDLPEQHHLRAATVPLTRAVRLAMLLLPARADQPTPFAVAPFRSDGQFAARVEHAGRVDELLVSAGPGPVEHAGRGHDAVALWVRDGQVKLKIAGR